MGRGSGATTNLKPALLRMKAVIFEVAFPLKAFRGKESEADLFINSKSGLNFLRSLSFEGRFSS